MHELTIVIVAYNAEQTIARAVRSAVAAGSNPILLVDDGSTDKTIQAAKEAGGEQITVVSQPKNMGVGAARNRAIHEVKTVYGMWLDADDEIMPQRPEVMLKALNAGADIVYDGGVLVDELTGEITKALEIPKFMFEANAEVRCFERNWFPILAGAFNVSFARRVGFDNNLRCSEDYDFLLRAMRKGGKFSKLGVTGYKYFHSGGSISRNIEKTIDQVKKSLSQHPVEAVEKLLNSSGLIDVEKLGVLAGMALYRQDYALAYQYSKRMNERERLIVSYAMKAGLFSDFIAASALAAMSRWQEAHDLLQCAAKNTPAADIWNNLGVTLHHLGCYPEANHAFQAALQLMPGYFDAMKNAKADIPKHWTTHPLRRQASRDSYSA